MKSEARHSVLQPSPGELHPVQSFFQNDQVSSIFSQVHTAHTNGHRIESIDLTIREIIIFYHLSYLWHHPLLPRLDVCTC